MANALVTLLWPLVADIAEEKAKAILADFVREINEESQQYLAGDGGAELDKLLGAVPDELKPLVKSVVIEYTVALATKPLQEAVDKAWAEVERINKSDVAASSPKISLNA